MSLMYTFMLTLVPCFTKIKGDLQVFDTAAQSMSDARIWPRYTVNMSSRMSSECAASTLVFCGLNFGSTVNIFCLKKQFHSSACQI